MSTSTEFVTRGILKYLSQGAVLMGAACVAVALPVEAKTERQAPAKVVVKQATKTKAGKDDQTKAAVLKRAAAKDKPVLQVKHVKGLAKPVDDEEEAAPRGKKLKVANAKAARNARVEEEEAVPAGRKGKAARLAKAAEDEARSSRARNKIAGKLKATDDEEEVAPKGRKLTKAERIKAERQARLEAEETARQKRIDSTRDKRLQAQRKAREEAAEQARLEQMAREKRQQEIARLERQQELARQKRMVAAREARERALEEDRIATLAAERSAGVRVMAPGAAATMAVATAAVAPTAASTAPAATSVAPAPVSYVPATPVAAAAMGTPVAVAATPAPVRKTNTVSASSPLAAALIGSEVERAPAPRPYTYTPNPDSPVAAALIAPQTVPSARPPVTRSYVAQTNSPVAASLIATAAPVSRAAVTPVERSNFVRVSVPANNTLGQIRGMSTAGSPLVLNSSVALVMDQNTGEVLLNKNGGQVSPIASITKLMTALVTMDASLPMDERITITYDDVDQLKGSSSRLSVGSTFTRQELLHLALMSSENRAAHALGRTYPGGLPAFVRAMNMRATMLGMRDTNYVEPTGLNSGNRSSARDLALLTRAAYSYPLIRSYTTHPGQTFDVAGQMRRFNNTNRLVHSNDWNIGLQKTGYISEAGRCVVMQSNIDGRNVIIVLLDSNNSSLRVRDAESIRYWVQNNLGRGGSRSYGSVVAQVH